MGAVLGEFGWGEVDSHFMSGEEETAARDS